MTDRAVELVDDPRQAAGASDDAAATNADPADGEELDRAGVDGAPSSADGGPEPRRWPRRPN